MPRRGGTAVFLFRRDFRTAGNPAWARCAAWCSRNGAGVAPCFVFSDRQASPSLNPYYSPRAFAAMLAALAELDRELGGGLCRFRVRDGLPDTHLLAALAAGHDVRAVFFNPDVTPFARERDAEIARWCRREGVHFEEGLPGDGYLLWPAGSVLTKSGGTVPKSFSAFHRYTADRPLPRPAPLPARQPPRVRLPPPSRDLAPTGLPSAEAGPAASAAGVMRALAAGDFDGYGRTRDDYGEPSTRLSVHLKFGRADPAEAMRVARARGVAELQRQLLWREFYYHLAHGYPRVLSAPNAHIRPDRDRARWPPPDPRKTGRWQRGETGEPLVDQAMRELALTGYLHNRLRMVVASYFVRELGQDWREGERLLAGMLADYDPCQNSGGWQAADAQIPGQEIKASTQLAKYGPVPARTGQRG